eukprot:861759-Prorocentrum_minimum.AAC.3
MLNVNPLTVVALTVRGVALTIHVVALTVHVVALTVRVDFARRSSRPRGTDPRVGIGSRDRAAGLPTVGSASF